MLTHINYIPPFIITYPFLYNSIFVPFFEYPKLLQRTGKEYIWGGHSDVPPRFPFKQVLVALTARRAVSPLGHLSSGKPSGRGAFPRTGPNQWLIEVGLPGVGLHHSLTFLCASSCFLPLPFTVFISRVLPNNTFCTLTSVRVCFPKTSTWDK